jgi:hypothetical protein
LGEDAVEIGSDLGNSEWGRQYLDYRLLILEMSWSISLFFDCTLLCSFE